MNFSKKCGAFNFLAISALLLFSDKSFSQVLPGIDTKALKTNISLTQNRHIAIQRTDGGWEFLTYNPDSLRDLSQPSFSNQFGSHALAVLEAYAVTKEPLAVNIVKRTSEVLMQKPVFRSQRLAPPDNELLITMSSKVGFDSYLTKASQSQQAEKDFSAALYILNQTSPTDTDVNAIPQSQLDTVTNAQRVAAFKARQIAFGRNAGLRAYDWGYRANVASLLGDTAYQRAIADLVAADFPAVVKSEYYYITGLANTIITLKPFQNTVPLFNAIINSATALLEAQQKSDGFFMVTSDEGAPSGTIADEAFVVEALLQLGDWAPLTRFINAIMQSQLPNGAYDDFGREFVEGQAEMMRALSHVWVVKNSSVPSISEIALKPSHGWSSMNAIFVETLAAKPVTSFQ